MVNPMPDNDLCAFTVRLPKDTYDFITNHAKRERRNKNATIIKVIEIWIEEEKKKKGVTDPPILET